MNKSIYKLLSVLLFCTASILTNAQINAQLLGRYSIGTYNSNGGVAEISAYDPSSKRMFVVNGPDSSVKIVNIANPANPVLVSTISVKPYGIDVTSVACNKNGVFAIAVIDSNGKTNPSNIVFLDANGTFISKVKAGANADHIIFTSNGQKLIVANEGEPNVGYTIDPEGSISIIDLASGVANITQANVQTAGFTAFNSPTVINPNIRILGRIQSGGTFLRNSTVAEDLEPEYIAISEDNSTAWVTCQENNALAVVNINTATVTSLLPLGFKNHNLAGNGLDPSDQSGAGNTASISISNWPVFGMYQPDGISSYRVGNQTFLVTANEGDARADWGTANNEEIRVNNVAYVLDSTKFGGATGVAAIKANAALGRLNVSNRWGDFNNDGKFDSIYTFGARSFSIWNGATGALVWDSEDDFEQRTAIMFPNNFNSGHTTNSLDDRSDNKGPEPESVTIGKIADSTYAFVGLERIGGIMIYNITNPSNPYFSQYINTRNFSITPSQANLASVGDLGPEGILFIPRNESPTGENLIVLSNEVSGTVSFYTILGSNVKPNSSKSPYLTSVAPGVKFDAIISVGDSANNGYKMVGIPDGAGAYDNNNGTFTLLVNHELGSTVGVVRAHGAKGAFVSKWVIDKNNLSVISGSDLIEKVNLYTTGTGYTLYNPADTTSKKAFGRFCSADLPSISAFYNSLTGLGTQERIFMNGEETGIEGRAFGHIVTGTNAGTTYELPNLGKFSWENAVASPASGNNTVVGGMDDGTDGQVYFYVGTKTNTGNEMDKAGLTNGRLYGIAVTGLAAEDTATVPTPSSVPAPNTPFTMVDLGIVKDSSGLALNTRSNALSVTKFLRPEDGLFDPSNPNDFYFVTTNSFVKPSRMWRLRFNDIKNPTIGGTITAVLDGTEGPKMMDNIGIDKFGNIIIQEDVGNQAHLGKTWQYSIVNDKLTLLASHDSTRFLAGGANFLTQDEEGSGIIDVQDILGAGNFLLVDQAHYATSTELVEGGQILKMFNPTTANAFAGALPNSSQTPYLTAVAPGVKFNSIISVGDMANNGYKMVGIPDGAGAYDNNNGTFTLLVNHELGSTVGINRAHGAKGAFVSKWVIDKNNLSVISGSDLIEKVNLYTTGTGYTLYNPADTTSKKAFGRFCSADLPSISAFYNSLTGLGTQERIFMNGEETGVEGRAFGHIVTGTNAGTTYELPNLGKFSWENAVASPASGNITLVGGMDDGTDGQVYFYVGTKTNTGNEMDKAGLTNGRLYGIAVTGLPAEISASVPAPNTPFTMVDLGIVKDSSGLALNTRSNALSVTKFLRPEDGLFDPSNHNDFYFVTTNSFTAPSKMWKLRFNDIKNPTSGGTITAVLDGTEGPKMMDNIGIDNSGHIIIQEDVGNQAHLSKTWQYTIATDKLVLLASHDSTRFIAGGANFLTQDEEGSGVIDVQDILGVGNFLLVDQAHYATTTELVEGGQILKMFNPTTANGKQIISIAAARALNSDTVRVRGVITRAWGRFIYIQDATGAIAVRQSAGAMVDSILNSGLKEGDSVEVVGGRGNFNNYAQINIGSGAYGENSRITKLGVNATIPAPSLVTIKDINTNGEQYESKVVRIIGLRTNATAATFPASSNNTVWDGPNAGDTTILRIIAGQDTEIEDAPALAIPKGAFIFEGILAQFCSSPTSGCANGYQIYGVRKKDITEMPLTAFNLLNPATNAKVTTDSASAAAIQINWTKSANALRYKWMLTTETGNFTNPLLSLLSNNLGADSLLTLTSGGVDAILASLNIAKGDSVKTKWTVFAYKGVSDSLQASQVFNLTLARSKPIVITLGAFNLNAPANNARVEVEEANASLVNINWTKSANAISYKWFATTALGSFATPLLRVNSNNVGADTVLTLTSGGIDAILNSLNIKRTDSVILKWTVYAYLSPTDSLKATQDWNVKLVRKRILGAFNLTAPANNARLEVEEGNATAVAINWSASAKASTYKWKAANLTGNFNAPLLNLNSDNAGADNKLTLASGGIDAILASNGIAKGDSITLKWTVFAYETTDSLQAVETFNINLVRKTNVGVNNISFSNQINVYPNPANSALTIATDNLTGNLNIKLYSLTGKLLIDNNMNAVNDNKIDVSQLQDGVYLLSVTAENGKSSQVKIVVMH